MRRVGEITETVGGLNRNAWALSPKYAGYASQRGPARPIRCRSLSHLPQFLVLSEQGAAGYAACLVLQTSCHAWKARVRSAR
jgi:hypothetical protein